MRGLCVTQQRAVTIMHETTDIEAPLAVVTLISPLMLRSIMSGFNVRRLHHGSVECGICARLWLYRRSKRRVRQKFVLRRLLSAHLRVWYSSGLFVPTIGEAIEANEDSTASVRRTSTRGAKLASVRGVWRLIFEKTIRRGIQPIASSTRLQRSLVGVTACLLA